MMTIDLPINEKTFNLEQDNIDIYWQQTQAFDAYSSDCFIDITVFELKSSQAFVQSVIQEKGLP